ncbi:Smr/MutS family protein [Sphingomonas bacterium]|uniref:Smr/MutS family protein n=1 Tax=Sphingomonas bacterium TaxID=1895847 RepID=UPI0020C6B518|nr:Smr/MutS family protein [Sphingomonas bacterium]
MPGPTLDADYAQLWARVMATVRPLHAVAAVAARPMPTVVTVTALAKPRPATPPNIVPAPKRVAPGITLDGGWDRRIAKGGVAPDVSIDLHGHTLASAHALLDTGLDRAIRRGDRVVLLVTGKPPRPESERPHARGAIRASVADWLASSRHAGAIAAVRGAHPRHGGAGALYIILRRAR